MEPDQAQQEQTALAFGVVNALVAAALATFALFLVDVVADVLPPQPQDPLWLLKVATAFVNVLTIPVAGVLFLHLAAALAPLADLGQQYRTWASRIATSLALVFLLLLPLLGFATWRGITNVQTAVQQRAEQVNRNADRVRAAIRKASTPRELQQLMVEQRGPSVSDADFNIPLARLKESKLQLVNQVQFYYTSQIPSLKTNAYEPILLQTLRTTLLALAGSTGFAALAWGPKRQQSLLRFILDTGNKFNAGIANKFNALRPTPDDKNRNDRLMQKSRNMERQTMQRNKREMAKRERQQRINFEKIEQAREKQKKKESDKDGK